jgi:hypothetical protein
MRPIHIPHFETRVCGAAGRENRRMLMHGKTSHLRRVSLNPSNRLVVSNTFTLVRSGRKGILKQHYFRRHGTSDQFPDSAALHVNFDYPRFMLLPGLYECATRIEAGIVCANCTIRKTCHKEMSGDLI